MSLPIPAPPPVVAPGHSPFSALRHRNFRLFLGGQMVSLTGTWLQNVAQGWLVLQLTHSAFMVGLVSTLGTLPILLFTLYGGVVADRVNKRRFILMLQAFMLVDAAVLGLLTLTGVVTVPWVMGLALVFGLLSAFEVPTRQAFVIEMAGRADLMNAIALNSSVFNLARIVGPAVAGILIATVGIAACFLLNAFSYLAVITSLLVMRQPPSPKPPAGRPRFLDGLTYVLGEPWPRTMAILTATFSIFGAAFLPLLPVFADQVLHAGATGYGGLVSAVGVGASAAALIVAAFGHRFRKRTVLLTAGMLFGVFLIAASFTGNYWIALILLTLAGTAQVMSNVLTNTLLQAGAPDHLRGRVMG
ncbi:MAG: MFS transporter, partial [Gemmatimonadales bacterium]